MGREWTKEQRDAMEARGGTLLVSAAAGSGKTAVLVERVIGLITDEKHPCDADRLLVVTFTSAAASELRERASRRLSDMIEQNPLDGNLQRQQMLLQNAHISTIHAFCLDLLREHFEKLDIPPDFRIADQNEIEILMEDVLGELLEEKYAAGMRGENGAFLELSRILSSGRGDKALVDTILRLYDFIRSLADPDGWLDKMAADYRTDAPVQETEWGKIALTHAKLAAESAKKAEQKALQRIYEDAQLTKAYAPAFESDVQGLDRILKLTEDGDWDNLVAFVRNFSFARLGTLRKFEDDVLKEELKATRETVKKKTMPELASGVLCCTAEEFRQDRMALAPVVACLAETVRELDRRFYREKLARGVLDFSDLEQLALKLLIRKNGENIEFTQTASEISQRFDEVLVDEYQDTNPAQDMIFRAVSGNDRSLFMVGDVKQSIYRFRQAMPEIFIGRAAHCEPYGNGNFPAKIILGRNFRSRKGVTSAVNYIFGRMMTEQLGGVNYGKEEELVPGAEYFERQGADFALHLIGTGDYEGDEDGAELEARHIAREIHRLVDEDFLVQGDNGPRPAAYRDFCILLRSMAGRAEKYARALEEEGVPSYADIAAGYLGAYEVMVMMSLLRILDNPLQDIPLVSVLLSPVFGFTPDDAAKIRIQNRKSSLYLAMLELSQSGDAHFDAFLALLEKLRTLAAVLPADRLILRIFDETGFLNIFEAMPGGELRSANLRLLLDYARAYESAGYRGLAGFLRFIDRLDRQKSDLAPASAISETANVVRIMSIHKSKGLEFPICFLAGCSKRFNNEDTQKPVLFHPSCGFGSMIRDKELNCKFTTLPREIVKLELQKSMLSEEMRVLYVAMTRAKEKLYAVVTLPKPENALKKAAAVTLDEKGKALPFEAMAAQNPAEWILTAALRHPSCSALRELAQTPDIGTIADDSNWELRVINADELAACPVENKEEKAEVKENDETVKAKLLNKLGYSYPHGKSVLLPSKVSVSELTHGSSAEFNAEHIRPAFLENEKLTPAEAGTALHAFLQYADFQSLCDESKVKSEIDRLVRENYLLPEQGNAVNIRKVLNFASSELFGRMEKAEKVLREFRFNLEVDAGEVFEDAKGLCETMILQGMADLVFMEKGSAVLLDYKTDRVTRAEELAERYSEQLHCYERAVREILQTDVKEKYIYSFHLGKAVKIE